MSSRRGLRVSTVVAVVATLVTVCSEASPAANDPPRIVRWHQIGDIGLGMSRTRIQYEYGVLGGSQGGNYAVPGGRLYVGYDKSGHVYHVATSSPRYRTPDGIHVGLKIPLGPCHLLSGKCVYRWRGFVLSTAELGNTWVMTARYGPKKVSVSLSTVKGVVEYVSIDWPDPYGP